MTMNLYANDKIYQVGLNSIINAYKGNGVFSGFDVTLGGGRDLIINAGQCYFENSVYGKTSGTLVTIDFAHQVHPRIDIIIYDISASTVVVIKGNAGIIALPPGIPPNAILLAMVHMPAGCTAIAISQIIDGRILVKRTGLVYILSENLLKSDDAEVSDFDFRGYRDMKVLPPVAYDVYSNESEFRLEFEMKVYHHAGVGEVYVKFYKNNDFLSVTGVEHTTSSETYVLFSEDISGWSANDIIKLKGKTQHDGDGIYIKNFRIRGEFKPKSIINW